MQRRANNLKVAINLKLPAVFRAPNKAAPRVQQVYKEYQREAMPEYKGGIREYATFNREWKNCVAPGGDEASGDAAKIVELQNKLMTLYYDLKAIQQESQVTQNIYLLQKTVQKIPEEYQNRYADV